MSYKKLFSSINSLSGISDKISSHLARISITRVIDFLLHIPRKVMEVKINPLASNIDDGDSLLLRVELLEMP